VDREERLRAFNAAVLALTEEYGCRIAPVVIFPGGEEVSLVSVLRALGIQAKPGLRIVGVQEQGVGSNE
jgi:hypothetical protein